MKKFKDWINYRRNLKKIKRNTVAVLSNLTDVALFASNVATTCKSMTGDELISTIIIEISNRLNVTVPQLTEILQTVSTMSQSDIETLLKHGIFSATVGKEL